MTGLLRLSWFGGWPSGNVWSLFGRSRDEADRFRRVRERDEPAETSESPDQAMVARLRAGDETAFHEVWMQYSSGLASFAMRYVGSSDAAADVVQDAFVALWVGRNDFRPRTTIAAYLYRAVWHRAQNARRKTRTSREYLARQAAAHEAEPRVEPHAGERALEREEIRQFVARLLSRMTPRVKEIFLMSRDEGLSAPEIAHALGISPQVVRNKLSLATKLLAENLRELQGKE